MKDKYSFVAIFSYENEGISIEFPDLEGCFSCATDTEEALNNAKDVLGLYLWGMEKDKEIIPKPTEVKDFNREQDQVLVLVEVYMPLIRNLKTKKSVNKTVTIPEWLNEKAEEEKINFSKTLQEALKEKLRYT